jgi:hypothetical protein
MAGVKDSGNIMPGHGVLIVLIPCFGNTVCYMFLSFCDLTRLNTRHLHLLLAA